MNNEILFETQLIDASRYRESEKIRYGLYYGLFFIFFLICCVNIIQTRHCILPHRIAYYLFWSLVGLLFLVGVVSSCFHYYTEQFIPKGSLVISNRAIELITDISTTSWTFEEITKLHIERGATYHYAKRDDNYAVDCNNWLSFCYNGIVYKHEFLINSVEANRDFERVIKTLKIQGVRLGYASI